LLRKGQSSVEYLTIVAIALMVLIPGSYLFLNYAKSSSEQVASSQLNLIGVEIVNEAEKMFILGKDSWITLEINFPGVLLDSKIYDGTELFFSYSTSIGDSFTVFFPLGFNISNSTSPCSGECSLGFTPGLNRIRIQSQGSFVSIRRV